MMEERDIVDKLYVWEQQGAAARHDGSACPHRGGSLAAFMHSGGWLKEDLRCALMRKDRGYCLDQARHENKAWGYG